LPSLAQGETVGSIKADGHLIRLVIDDFSAWPGYFTVKIGRKTFTWSSFGFGSRTFETASPFGSTFISTSISWTRLRTPLDLFTSDRWNQTPLSGTFVVTLYRYECVRYCQRYATPA